MLTVPGTEPWQIAYHSWPTSPSGYSALMTYDPSVYDTFMTSTLPGLRYTRDLSGQGLSAWTTWMAEQDKWRRALGYGGQGST